MATTSMPERLAIALLAVSACGTPVSDNDGGDERADAADAIGVDRDEALLDVAPDAPHDGSEAGDVDADVPRRDVATDVVPTEPDFDTLPWITVGNGVAYKDSHNPRGQNVFIGDAGYQVTQAESEAWVTQLFHAWLQAHGVRYVFAVQGPDDIGYAHREIGNTHLIATLLPMLSPATHFIAIAGHSSGGWVACELLQQLYEGGLDPSHLTRGRTVYYDMDGVGECVDGTMVSNLRKAYFMSAHTNVGGGGTSINYAYMMMAAARLGSGGFHVYDASGSGCEPTAGLCLHISLINTHPPDPSTGAHTDYANYSRGPVNDWFLASTATDLPL